MHLLDYEGLKAKGINFSRPHLWRLVRSGALPAPVKIGMRNVWVEGEIDAYIEAKIANRDRELV